LLCSAAFLFGVLGLAGCGSKPQVVAEVSPSNQNLRAISTAYLQATDTLGRPPNNLEELKPFLKGQGGPEAILTSPDDGEPYTILWGVDYRTVPMYGSTAPVLAYEKQGKGGKRFVLRMRDVTQLTNEDFQKATFPPGFQAPSL
jgi:hypothetical protein